MIALLIPTGSDHDRSRLPVATLSLISLNLLVAIVVNCLDYEKIVHQFGFVAAQPHWYQFITSLFLHAGWPRDPSAEWTAYLVAVLHIGGNMAYLWFAGSDLEDVLGAGKFLGLYFLSGFASALLFWFTAWAGNFPGIDEPCVGASGAIAGLLGFYLVRFPRFKIRMWFGAFIPIPLIMRQGITRISSLVFIGFWIGLQLVFGVQALRAGGAEVAYWGHIGGFLLGFAMAMATRQWREGGEEYLLKEADHRFYKQKWYPAMELYQRIAERYPHCVEAVTKWALCWECVGLPRRAEKVLYDALAVYRGRGWEDHSNVIEQEIASMTRKGVAANAAHTASPQTAASAPSPHPNLMFRREFKWKGKPQ
ncbi:MAG TPA: rhomboid family intramembrane serine protease [Verrucomicrobiae bacterium]|nr:rhomboid family intramembrane serine protease [Verrucomicrobiae bacterium]